MKLLGRMLCAALGHKRGKRLATHKDGIRPGFDLFECPRCRATWTRKKPKLQIVNDGSNQEAA